MLVFLVCPAAVKASEHRLVTATKFNHQKTIHRWLEHLHDGHTSKHIEQSLNKKRNGKTLLHWATLYNRVELVNALLFYGADPRKADNRNTLAINYAATLSRRSSTLKCLRQKHLSYFWTPKTSEDDAKKISEDTESCPICLESFEDMCETLEEANKKIHILEKCCAKAVCENCVKKLSGPLCPLCRRNKGVY